MTKKISKKLSFVGENIRKIRQAKSISQAEFAAILNIGRPSVGAYEEGRSEPKIETLIQIANHFSISIDALLTKQLTVTEIYSFDRLNKKLDKVHQNKDLGSFNKKAAFVKTNGYLDYIIRRGDSEFIKGLDKIEIPLALKDARVFEMKGSDMANHGQGVNEGDLLFCIPVLASRLKSSEGEVIVTVTPDEILCRRLQSVKKGNLTLSADAFGTSELIKPAAQALEIWHVVAFCSRFINPPPLIEYRMNQLEELVKKLSK